LEKDNKMQEVFKNGSEGEVHVEDTLEDLLPHIKKSLENPKVKFVKVYTGKSIMGGKKKFTAEEEKKNIMDEIAEEKKKF